MNNEEVREYCLSKKAVTESFPFNDTALVFKVANKMFAVLDLSIDSRGITLKCDPELAIELRAEHPEVTPAWHFNKAHWNAIAINSNLPDELIYKWIDHSYALVVSSLTKKKQAELKHLPD